MRCPRCSSVEDKVIESRSLADGKTVRRRRECANCGFRFTSYERIEEKSLMVVKKSTGRREPFDRGKLERGVRHALRKRLVSQRDVENLIDELEEQATLEGMESHEIAASRLGEMVLERLYTLDKVAYIRFASVYRNYRSVEEFIAEIETLSERQEESR